MNRREFLKLGTINIAASSMSAAFLYGQTREKGRPNFVFILADDMGWTGTSVQMDDQVPESKSDYYRTPHLEQLAQQGLRFTQAYAPGSLCTPSRAGILTGRTPAALHVTTPGGGRSQGSRKLLTPPAPFTKIQASETTIAEALKEAGYATAHLGKWHLGQNSHPGEHGFDVHDGSTANHGPGVLEDPNPKDIFGITERAVAFMTEQTRKKKPFYLHLSHYAVHSPTLARESTVRTFDNLPRGRRHRDASYAAMTFDLDTSIGTVLAEIEKLGIADNTYVVFMSDNGAPSGPRRPAENQPLAGGKSQLYEGGIRVPFIARGPGIPAGAICREAITGFDLFPTFCELAGISSPEKVEGTSLVPLLTGKPDSFQRKEISLLFHYPHYGRGPGVPQSALVVGKYKIIRNHESGSVQLFDLAEDLSEANDLAGALPEKAKELEQLLDDRLKHANAQMTSVNPNYDPDTPVTRGQRRGPGRRRATTPPRRRRPE
jgi:arylsulfatase A-like enzyme